MKNIFIAPLLGIILFSSPLASIAQSGCVPGQGGIACPLEESQFGSGPSFFIDLIDRVANWMFTFLLVIAVIFIVTAAYKYLFSGGGEETAAAHKMLIYAAVAVAVALLSRGFVYVIKQVVGDTVPAGQQAPPGNNGGNASNNTPPQAVTFSPVQIPTITDYPDFALLVQVCPKAAYETQAQTPGITMSWDTHTFDNWYLDPSSQHDQGNPGNPNIPAAGASPNAGQFVTIGSVSTGNLLSLGIFGTEYVFKAEICNDGTLPIVRVDTSGTGNSYQTVGN